MFKRSVWEKVKIDNVSVGEDMDFANRAIRAGFKSHWVANKDAYIYMRHARNTWIAVSLFNFSFSFF